MAKSSMFKRGFKAVNEEKERQEKAQAKRKGVLYRLFLGDDKDEADISFLTEQPINFWEHTLKTNKNGKEFYDNVPCSGEGCKHCEDGNSPQFKSAWLVVDHREVQVADKDNPKKKKTITDQVRLLVFGTKTASQLERKSEKYGLVGRIYTMVRLGKGTSTSYTFEHGDKHKLTTKEIENLLSEDLKKEYEGDMESLYEIVQNQIVKLLDDGETDEEDEDDDEDMEDEIVEVEDDEDDDDEEEDDEPKKKSVFKSSKNKSSKTSKASKRKQEEDDEDEEEEEKPKKSIVSKKKKVGKKETSTKPSVKSIIKGKKK